MLPAQDADYLGLAAPPREITVVGDVRCLVANPVTARGQQVDPAAITSVQCGALWDAVSG